MIHRSFAVLILFVFATFAAIGQSAIITLSFPYGARSYAMGEVGAALADDESCVFWNPAGLGVNNERWRNGGFTYFYEPLLPAFGIPDLWHISMAACYQQPPSELGPMFDIGGFGFMFNYLNFGENEEYNFLGHKVGSFNSYEYVIGLSWGVNFAEFGVENLSAGISIKYAHSALAPGLKNAAGDGVGQTFAVDLGVLYCFDFGLRLGYTLLNMGPSVWYIKRSNADPIPFTSRMAVAYKKKFLIDNLRIGQICSEYNMDWEIKHVEGWSEVIHNWGYEVTAFNTGAFRQGYLYDEAGSRNEWHFGFGVSLMNHLQFDWSYIYSPRGSIARDGQWGISFSLKDFFVWSEKDFMWWLAE